MSAHLDIDEAMNRRSSDDRPGNEASAEPVETRLVNDLARPRRDGLMRLSILLGQSPVSERKRGWTRERDSASDCFSRTAKERTNPRGITLLWSSRRDGFSRARAPLDPARGFSGWSW